MSRRATFNIFRPGELAAYVTGLVAFGRYATASEVGRAGLHLLQEKEGASPGTPLAERNTKMRLERH